MLLNEMMVFGVNVEGPLIALAQFGIFALYVGALWGLVNWITPFDDHHELFVVKNVSYITLRAGLVIGQVLGMYSSLGSAQSWLDLIWPAISGAATALLLMLTYVVVNAAIGRNVPQPSGVGDRRGGSRHMPTRHELEDPRDAQLGVNLVKAGFFVAIGLVVNGAFDGSAPDFATAALATVVFIGLGVLLLVGWYFANSLLAVRLFGYNIRAGVRDGRLPACYEATGMVVAQALVIQNAVAGDFVGWGAAFNGFFITVVVTLLVAYVLRWVFDRLVLTDCQIADLHRGEGNAPVAAFVAAAFVLMVYASIPLAGSFAAVGL